MCSRLFHSLFQTGLSFLSLTLSKSPTLLLFNGILIGCNRCAKRARVKSKEKKRRNRKKVSFYSTPTHKHIKRQQQHHATKQKEHRHINRRKGPFESRQNSLWKTKEGKKKKNTWERKNTIREVKEVASGPESPFSRFSFFSSFASSHPFCWIIQYITHTDRE